MKKEIIAKLAKAMANRIGHGMSEKCEVYAEVVAEYLVELELHRNILIEALQHYESPDNWECDDVGIARVWRQPNANMPKAYAGFELAMKALDGLKKEK